MLTVPETLNTDNSGPAVLGPEHAGPTDAVHRDNPAAETACGSLAPPTEGSPQAIGTPSPFPGWGDVPPAAGPAEPLPPGVTGPGPSPAPASADAAVEALITAKLNGIEAGWMSSELGSYIHDFFGQVAAARPSAILVSELVARLRKALLAKRKSSPSLGELKKMFQLAAATTTRQTTAATDRPPTRALEFVPDAPAAPNIVVPGGWVLTPTAVEQALSEDRTKAVAPTCVLAVARTVNVAEGTEGVKLAWKHDGRWKELHVDRAVVANKAKIIDLAAFGFPVTSNTAADVVQYLADFLAANRDTLPVAQTSSQMGWAPDKTSFLWGRQAITAETVFEGEQPAEGDPCPPTEGPAGAPVTFRGASPGEEQLAEAYQAHGAFADWHAALRSVFGIPKVRLGVLAALSAPLLDIVGAPNFGVDYCGETSKGKTTCLRLAASVWGNPDEKASAAAMSTWNATKVFKEQTASVLNNLPAILDETKLVRNKSEIGEFLYEMMSGRGRGRGAVGGARRTATWHTVLLSSGEAPATSYSQDGGTKARVLTLWGVPFGRADQATAALVKKLDGDIREAYGHAGPRFVRHLLRHQAQWPAWRARYAEYRAKHLHQAADDSVVGRLADTFAVLDLTADLAAEALGVGGCEEWRVVEPLWDTLTAEAADADRAADALRHAYDWAVSHEDEFYLRRKSSDGQPHGGWAGQWAPQQYGQPRWEFLGFVVSRLKDLLAAGEFHYEEVVRVWQDRGWLVVDPSDKSKRYHQAKVGDGGKPKLICVKRKVLEDVLGHQAGEEQTSGLPSQKGPGGELLPFPVADDVPA